LTPVDHRHYYYDDYYDYCYCYCRCWRAVHVPYKVDERFNWLTGGVAAGGRIATSERVRDSLTSHTGCRLH